MVRPIRHWYLCAGALLTGAVMAPVALGDDEPVLAPAPIAAGGPVEPTPIEAAPDKKVSDEPSVVTAAKPASPSSDKTDVEVVRERYPDGKIKVEREVIRDHEENYVNHGLWKMWDKSGNVVGEGRYVNGQRQGVWTGWFMPAEVPLLNEMPYSEYKGPFISQAEFDGGKLNGHWTIYDAKQRKISEWNYLAGQRHGQWVSWYANGRKMREVSYVNGDLDGTVLEWSPDGAQTTKDTYQSGHKLARKVEYYSATQKKSEGMYLFAKQELQAEDDWWDAKLAKFTTVDKDERHGESMSWHPNGQVHIQGSYEHDQPVGTHTWWFANGQKAVEGSYTKGQRHGQWTWYHPNGQKSTYGEFAMGGPHGKWIWWSPAGKVSQKVEYSAGGKSEAAAVVADKGSPPLGDKVDGADEPKKGTETEPELKKSPEPTETDSNLVPQAAGEPETDNSEK